MEDASLFIGCDLGVGKEKTVRTDVGKGKTVGSGQWTRDVSR